MTIPAHHIGIDFGARSSSLARYDVVSRQPVTIMNAEGELKTPSVVCYTEHEVLVGTSALHMLDGEDARRGVIVNVKRDLGQKVVYPVPGRRVTPVEVVADILRKLKHDAEEGHFHEPVTRATLTHPA